MNNRVSILILTIVSTAALSSMVLAAESAVTTATIARPKASSVASKVSSAPETLTITGKVTAVTDKNVTVEVAGKPLTLALGSVKADTIKQGEEVTIRHKNGFVKSITAAKKM